MTAAPVKAIDKTHLSELLKIHMETWGHQCDLNHIDVSSITDFSYIFYNSHFQGDISKWNVSNAQSMNCMFRDSRFNGDLSLWNVSNVHDMFKMFHNAMFQGDISRWDVSNVTDMTGMFRASRFNGDLSLWNLACLESFEYSSFSKFHDSPLGYIDILQHQYDLPKNFPRAAQFQQLRSLCDGLNLDVVRAAQFIYQEMHVSAPIVAPPEVSLDFR